MTSEDDRAIREVVLRYCRGVDRLDLELVRSCYHPDAKDTHGSFSGGLEEFLTWVERILRRYTMTMHYIANQLVDASGDDRARCESYGVAVHRTSGGEAQGNLTTGFRFIDDFERRQGEWRIVRRVATTEWVQVSRAEDQWPVTPTFVAGRRDRGDPVYAPWGS